MIDPQSLRSFVDELEKISGVLITKGNPKRAVPVAGGIFVGGIPKEQHQAAEDEIMGLIGQHSGSLLKTHEAYSKKYPKRFVTYAIKRQEPPGGLRHRLGKLFNTKGSKERELDMKNRFFMSFSDQVGGSPQRRFYEDVARNRYESELPEKLRDTLAKVKTRNIQ